MWWYLVDTISGLSYLFGISLYAFCIYKFCSMLDQVKGHIRRAQYRSRCKDCIIIFCRYPEAGATKTRLIPTLGPHGAAYCQLLMTDHIIDTVSDYGTDSLNPQGCEVEVQYKGGAPSDVEYWLERKQRRTPNLVWREQTAGDLGDKLRRAVLRKFSQGKEKVLVIGGDTPGITKKELYEAFTKLQLDNDMVLGAAEDGGYYLVGFKNTAERYMSKIFSDVKWGTSEVFKQQCDNAKKCGASLGVLSSTINNVDASSDLHIFEKEVGVHSSDVIKATWSIIIPVLNEAHGIRKTLESVVKNCSDINFIKEVLVCDGGSTDNTCDIAVEFGRRSPVTVRVLHLSPGRGFQLKAGAREARSEYFLFLHGDSVLPLNYDIAAFQCLNKPGVVAGAFDFSLDLVHRDDFSAEDRSLRTKLVWLERMVWLRSRPPAELTLGDQCLFLRRQIYNKIGGYQEVYLLEDFLMVNRLKEYGHVRIADCGPIVTSARRWKEHGFIKVTSINHLITTCYKFGVHPNTLAKWYYGDKLKTH